MNRQRVAAIIIQGKKILLVKDKRSDFYEMPGGKVEEGETQLTTLNREIYEEIGIETIEAKYYFSFDLQNTTYNVPQTDHTYLVSIKDSPNPSAEEITRIGWFSQEDIVNKKITVATMFYEKLLPKLVEDQLL
jgi:8-oxo-dGTP diphosphatase